MDDDGQGTLDLGIDLLSGADLDSLSPEQYLRLLEEVDLTLLSRGRLRQLLDSGIRARLRVRKRPAPEPRIARAVGLPHLQKADEHDLREAVRVLVGWLRNPDQAPEPAQRSRYSRPKGVGRLIGPRCVKTALTADVCGLCNDPIKAGDDMGRFRPPKPPLAREFVAMGWLCRHCLFDRRHAPRRRDVLLRFFHHLLNASAVGLNAPECGALLTWLTDSGTQQSEAWKQDPLDATLVRLATSVQEDKPNTWIALPTSITILRTLRAAGNDPADADLLEDILQHVADWDTNPCGIDHRRFGTGVRYRQEVLRLAPRTTFLSELGGPFYLHKANEQAEPDEDETISDHMDADTALA
ncbi:hypothetical protein ABZ135_23335 [Streptomyces sp. NPDC006339]|uniref:hypothetical protein n=1 Tax=Streptomyces sp. NPDC006339 TaxID=3156755 RepID=UPI0033AFFC49